MANEVIRLVVNYLPGTTVPFACGDQEGEFDITDSDSDIKDAIEALSNIGVGNVLSVTGALTPSAGTSLVFRLQGTITGNGVLNTTKQGGTLKAVTLSPGMNQAAIVAALLAHTDITGASANNAIPALAPVGLGTYAEVSYAGASYTPGHNGSASNPSNASNAFDNDGATKAIFSATAGSGTRQSWLDIDFGSGNAKKPSSFTILTEAADGTLHRPVSMQFYGSVSGDFTDKVLLASGSGLGDSDWTSGLGTFAVGSPASYRYLRVMVDDFEGPDGGGQYYAHIFEINVIQEDTQMRATVDTTVTVTAPIDTPFALAIASGAGWSVSTTTPGAYETSGGALTVTFGGDLAEKDVPDFTSTEPGVQFYELRKGGTTEPLPNILTGSGSLGPFEISDAPTTKGYTCDIHVKHVEGVTPSVVWTVYDADTEETLFEFDPMTGRGTQRKTAIGAAPANVSLDYAHTGENAGSSALIVFAPTPSNGE